MKKSYVDTLSKIYNQQQQEEVKKIQELAKVTITPSIRNLQKVTEQQQQLVAQYLKSGYAESVKSATASVEKFLQEQKNTFEHYNLFVEDLKRQTEYLRKRALQDEPKLKESIIALINIGWYPDIEGFGYGTLRDIKDDIEPENTREIDDALVNYYQDIRDKIEEKIIEQFPRRAHIVREAFKAHREGNYIVSIPLFLTQVDGIAYDMFKSSFFLKSRGTNIPKISEHISSEIGYFSVSLLVPFQSEQPIIYSQKERGEDFNHLNRHQVLHGESVDYHTELNSCKAISLIYYISQAIKKIKDDNE